MTVRRLLPAVLAAFAAWMFLVFMFMEASGDEGGYHYQAVMLSRGYWPVLDFYQQHLPWAYIPFAAMAKLLSPALESMRLWTFLSYMAGLVLVFRMAKRAWGDGPAALALAVLGLHTYWLYANLELGHSAVANLGLLAAVYLLGGPLPRWRAVLFGAALGLMVNSRVVLLPVAVLLFILAVAEARVERWWRGLAMVAGGLLVSVPTLLLLAADTEAFLFNFLLGRMQATVPGADVATTAFGERVIAWLAMRGRAVGDFFTIGYLQRSGLPNLLTLIMLGALGFGLALGSVRACGGDRTMRLALWVILAVLFSYSLADRVNGSYFHHWIPLLALLAGGALHHLRFCSAVLRRICSAGLALLLLAEAGWWLAVTGAAVVRRAEPGVTRPLTVARLACWLDRTTPPGTVAMSFLGGSVAAADRWLPRGYEQAVGLIALYWEGRLPDARAERFHILTFERFLGDLAAGRIPVAIRDIGINELSPGGWTRVEAALADFERLAVPGFAVADIRVRKELSSALHTVPTAPVLAKPSVSYGQIAATEGVGAALRAGRTELGDSFLALPGDLAGALGRMVRGDGACRGLTRLLPPGGT